MTPTPAYSKEQLASLRSSHRDNSLISLLAQYNLTLPRNAHEWRVPPEPQAGYIRGITTTSVRLLCTDGILGWFAWDDRQVILGHMQFWEKLSEPKSIRAEGEQKEGGSLPKLSKKAKRLTDED